MYCRLAYILFSDPRTEVGLPGKVLDDKINSCRLLVYLLAHESAIM